jgi:hypothetical protein
MDSDQSAQYRGVIGMLIIVFLVAVLFVIFSQPEGKPLIPINISPPFEPSEVRSREDQSLTRETSSQKGGRSPYTFHIYNYLKKPIKVEVLPTIEGGLASGEPLTLVKSINPHERRGIPDHLVAQYIRRGQTLRFYVNTFDEFGKEKETLYGTYHLSKFMPKDKTIRELHIGMISSRWDQSSSGDISLWALPEAIQGYPWLKIHNMTGMYLSLNNNINISPYGKLRYTGRHNFGVSLGTIFRDQNGIFPDYKYKVPATDLYYGIISDLDQPLSGGYQMDSIFTDGDAGEQPVFLLNNGWMGGPATPNILNGFIPRLGPPTKLVDRWGKVISNEAVTGYVPPNDSSLEALPSECVQRLTQ